MTANGVKHWDNLITTGYAPGYRHCSLHISTHTGAEIQINLRPDQALDLFLVLQEMLQLAWDQTLNYQPIDCQPGERRPPQLAQRREKP